MTFVLSTFHNRVVRIALALFVFAALAVYALPTDQASAGTNGQKIHVHSTDSNVKVTRVRITGNNNAGVYTSYDSGTFPQQSEYWVNSYWWKGNVNVTVTLAILSPGQSKTSACTVNVPVSQASDWVNVAVNNSTSCWKSS